MGEQSYIDLLPAGICTHNCRKKQSGIPEAKASLFDFRNHDLKNLPVFRVNEVLLSITL